MQAERPILCYVTDSSTLQGGVAALPGVMRAALRAGVDWIQIREKDLPARQLVELTRVAVQEARAMVASAGVSGTPPLQRRVRILVNDRLDVALAAGANGVHLGGSSLPVAKVVDWLSKRGPSGGIAGGSEDPPLQLLVGRSCHSLSEAQQAERDGASYIIFGPVYATPSKEHYGAPQKVERLREVCGAVRIPVLAIGGITAENARVCLQAGAAGIAAIRMFQATADVAAVVRSLRDAR